MSYDPPSAIAGITVQLVWQFDTGTANSDPGSGKFRFNNANQGLATFIYVSDDTENGADVRNILTALSSGFIYIQKDDDNDAFHFVSITGASTGATGYVQVPISVDSSGGTALGSGDKCAYLILA